MEYKSNCRACDHKHWNYVCNWQVRKTGRIDLKPVFTNLWGLSAGLHTHGKDEDGKDATFSLHPNFYKNEEFEYMQETDCGCKCYIPSENLEFLEWKYDESSGK